MNQSVKVGDTVTIKPFDKPGEVLGFWPGGRVKVGFECVGRWFEELFDRRELAFGEETKR